MDDFNINELNKIINIIADEYNFNAGIWKGGNYNIICTQHTDNTYSVSIKSCDTQNFEKIKAMLENLLSKFKIFIDHTEYGKEGISNVWSFILANVKGSKEIKKQRRLRNKIVIKNSIFGDNNLQDNSKHTEISTSLHIHNN